MPKKKKVESAKEQSKRFIETAKRLGADKDTKALERVIEKVAPPRQPPKGALPSDS